MEVNLLIAILGVQTIVLLFVTVVLVGFLNRARRSADELRKLVQSATPQVTKILDEIDVLIENSQPVSKQIAAIGDDFSQIVGSTREATEQLADTIEESTFKARRQISRIDAMVSEAVDQTEKVSNTYSKELLDLIAKLSALAGGIRVASAYFRDRHRG